MDVSRIIPFLVLPASLFTVGCTKEAPLPPQNNEANIRASLAKLDPDDCELAEEQKFCPVKTENRLGSMGKPVKVIIKEQPVFLCCKGCEKQALADPDSTLARVEDLHIKAVLDKLDPDDRKMAEEQRFCAVEMENRLGSMGKPVKVIIKEQPVFLCCKGCERRALTNPNKTLAAVKKLKTPVTDQKKE
ncbi:MAG TPA: hypothetical protein VH592_00590 [Gemmataceae bacterium]|jgi:hypothetical protein